MNLLKTLEYSTWPNSLFEWKFKQLFDFSFKDNTTHEESHVHFYTLTQFCIFPADVCAWAWVWMSNSITQLLFYILLWADLKKLPSS